LISSSPSKTVKPGPEAFLALSTVTATAHGSEVRDRTEDVMEKESFSLLLETYMRGNSSEA